MDAAAVTDTTPPELPSLAEWRTRPETEETAETPEQVATAPVAEPTDRVDEDAEEEEETHAPPEKDGHRWKDPDSGMRLDLRRRPHRRMKALLEERHRIAEENRELKARLEAPAKPEKTPQASPQPVADPNDPEPQLEAFADQPDPTGRIRGRWRGGKRDRNSRHSRPSGRASKAPLGTRRKCRPFRSVGTRTWRPCDSVTRTSIRPKRPSTQPCRKTAERRLWSIT